MNVRGDLASKRNEIRDKIRDAAILEFAENGLRGTSTQAIADRAGISKTKLHYHISSKDELYQEALDQILETWAELFEGISMDHGPEALFSDYIRRKVRYSLQRPADVKLFVNEVMRGASRLRSRWSGSREVTSRAAHLITEWANQGLIRRVEPILLQFHIWALTEQYAVMEDEARYMLEMDDASEFDEELISSEIIKLVVHGLGPR